MMTQDDRWLPLFPLKTVLFPGGVLPLKVFEARYIDMVRACMKDNMPFGVVLIRSGQEVGAAAVPEDVGCLAHITAWEMPSLGVMMLRTRGGERFRICETRVLPDQRLEGRVELLPADASIPLGDEHVSCALTLKIVIDDIRAKGKAAQGENFEAPFEEPLRLDDAAWVANRWCEILPIPLKARQALLEVDNATTRLAIVHSYLRQHRIISA